MEKIDFESKVQVKDDKKDQLIVQLKKSNALRFLCEKNNIPESCIDEYPYRMKQWLIDVAPCQGCKGLRSCKQKTKGYFHDLEYDGFPETVLKACRFRNAYDKKRKHMDMYLSSDLPKKLEIVSFEDIHTESETRDYLIVMGKAMDASRQGKGIYLYGSLGSGKTYLAACACNDHARMKEKVAFVHYPTFTQRVVASLANNEFQAEMNRLMYASFLVLDDIGAESVTEFTRDQILLPILNTRYENNRTTWFTSNYDLATLKKHFQFTNRGKDEEVKAARIIERISCMSEEIRLVGKDRR
ncbi:MAG: ATP-binding protein [Solobacterium sp.]|nr:ATP-binding protein [Solobacterium sp.]